MTVSLYLRYQLLPCNVVSQLDAAWYPKEKVQQAKKKLVRPTQGKPSTKEGRPLHRALKWLFGATLRDYL